MVCCVLPGCAQIAGIEETSSGARSSLTFTRASVGAKVERTSLDLTGLEAMYLVPDATQLDGLRREPATLSEDGTTWTAMVPTGTPVMFQLPDYPAPTWRILDLPSADVQGLLAMYEHPAPDPAPEGATFTVNLTLPSPFVDDPFDTSERERFSFLSVGTWNARTWTDVIAELPDPGETVFAPPAFPVTSLTQAPPGRPYEKITTADSVLLLRTYASPYASPPKLTGYFELAPFDQDVAETTLEGTLTAITDDQTLAMQVAPADIAARYETLRPGMEDLSMGWTLTAAPGADLGMESGPSLWSGTVTAADTGMIEASYGNPFAARGWKSTFTWSTSARRTYTNQVLSLELSASTRQIVDAADAQTLDLPAPIPEVITLDGMTLSSDGVSFPQPARPVPVSLVLGAGAEPTLYSIELLEIVPDDANTALVRKRVVLATGARPSFTLPPELFEVGKTYNLRASVVVGGYPALADGDLTVRELPVATSVMDSGVFTVVAP